MASPGIAIAVTMSKSEFEHKTASSEPFYKKPYAVGDISFTPGQSVPFVKINGIAEDSVDTVAERVLNKLPDLQKIEFLLSVTGGVNDTNDRRMFLSGLKKILPGTCLTTRGIHERTFELKDLKEDTFLAIGLVNLDRTTQSPDLEELSKEFGFDTEGDMFVLDSNGNRWTFNPAALTENHIPTLDNVSPSTRSTNFAVGDLVLICKDNDQFKSLQGDRWNDSMAVSLGKIVKIREVCKNDDLMIHHPWDDTMPFPCNPKAVAIVNSERMTDLLEKQFEKHEPANINGELVQAVKEKALDRVIKILSRDMKKNTCQTRDMYKIGKDDATSNERFIDPYHDMFILYENSLLEHNESELEFRDRLERKLVSEILKRWQSAEPIPIVKLGLTGDKHTASLSVQYKGAGAETPEVVKREVDLMNTAEEIAAIVVGHRWSGIVDSRSEISKLAMTICENDDHRNFSRVIRHALIKGRSDFFELLCVMNSNIFRMFPLQKDDHLALGKQTKVLSDVFSEFQGLGYDTVKHLLYLLINVPVCKKGGYRVLGFPVQRDDAIQNDMYILTLWDTIFLWSIILCHDECAHEIWRKVENHLAMACIAYGVCSDVRELTENNMQQITDSNMQAAQMKICIGKWSKLANDTLNECFECGSDISSSILVMELPYWKNMSCFEIATQAGNKDFIRQHACQYLLDNIWIGEDINFKNPDSNTCLLIFENIAWFCLGFLSWVVPGKELKEVRIVPKMKLFHSLISYVGFLTLFSHVLLFDMHTKLSTLEYVLLAWVLTILAEEILQMSSGCSAYLKNAWNFLDVGAVVLFLLGFSLRAKYSSSDAPRVILAIDFVAFSLRLIQMFSIHKVLGPKIVMIRQMVQDLMYFLVILAVFFTSYAVASHAVLYPNSPRTWGTVGEIIRRPYWHLYGSLFLEETEGNEGCSDNSTQTVGANPRCPSETGKHVVPIMMGLYMLLVNILLLNMLIAMFSFTISEIHINAEKHWAYERYFVIQEYVSRYEYVPPLNAIWIIYKLVQCCQKKQNVFKAKKRNLFRKIISGTEATRALQLEANTVHKLLELQKQKNSTDLDNKMLLQMTERMDVFETTVLQELKKMHISVQQLNMKLEENTRK